MDARKAARRSSQALDGMKPLPYTKPHDLLIVALSIAGFLCAAVAAAHFGFSEALFVGSLGVACAAAFSMYQFRRAPFLLRATVRFIGYLTAFTALFLLFSLVPR